LKPVDSHIVIALFVRHPIPGRVKTRLASKLGETGACDLYRAMVSDIIVNISSAGLPLYLFHDGLDVVGLPLEWLNAAEYVVRQQGDSLGERMTAAFELLFSIGLERVILIGSDIPGIDESLLQSAIAALDRCDVVFSPAFDGGYCLVSSKKNSFKDLIFRNILWSTPLVLDMSLEQCKSVSLSYQLLAPRQDLDTLDDIIAYCRRPAREAAFTNAWLVSHGFMEEPPCNKVLQP
jgi:rSAM/selenodomain-associated transferase 1